MVKVDKAVKQAEAARRRRGRQAKKAAIWVGVLAVAGGLIYLAATTSNVKFGEDALGVIDFTSLDAAQKKTALTTANTIHCTCTCGLTLAECVATDSTCPLREGNIGKIRQLVEDAKRSPSS